MDRNSLESLYNFIAGELYEAADEDYLEFLTGQCVSEEGFPETADKNWSDHELAGRTKDAWAELTEAAEDDYLECLSDQLSDADRTFLDAKVVGELPGLTVQDRTQPDMDAVKPVYVDEAAKLAAEIDRFSSDFDPYEYKDTVDNRELQVQNIADDIRNGNSADYKKYLGTVIEESDNIEDVRKAAELLVKLAEYKPLAKDGGGGRMTLGEIVDGLEIYTVGRLNEDEVYITVGELQEFINEIKALEQEPCEDTISRQAATLHKEGHLEIGGPTWN